MESLSTEELKHGKHGIMTAAWPDIAGEPWKGNGMYSKKDLSPNAAKLRRDRHKQKKLKISAIPGLETSLHY
jgi:hypothetical protein